MPYVSVSVARDLLPPSQQEPFVRAIEDAVVTVEGEALRSGIGVALDGLVESPSHMRNCAAFIRITVVRDALSAEQRDRLARNVTEAAVAQLGEERRMGVWVVVEESVASGEWKIRWAPADAHGAGTTQAR